MSQDTTTKPAKPEKLFIDQQAYDWPTAIITAEELRQLGSLPGPDVVDLYHKVPGMGDVPVPPGSTVDLAAHPGADHFSSFAVGSHSGA